MLSSSSFFYIWYSLLFNGSAIARSLFTLTNHQAGTCRQATVLLSSRCLIKQGSLHEEETSPNPWSPRYTSWPWIRIDRSPPIMRASSLEIHWWVRTEEPRDG